MLQGLWKQWGRMLRLSLILMVVFGIVSGYLHLHVQRSVLDRQIHMASLRKAELQKRNRALKQALQNKIQNSYDHQTALPVLANNRIVHMQLAEIPRPSSRTEAD